MDLIKKNRLIANYLGCHNKAKEFHKSYDLIMEVVDKIINENNEINSFFSFAIANYQGDLYYECSFKRLGLEYKSRTSGIESIFELCIRYILQYTSCKCDSTLECIRTSNCTIR